MSGFVIDIFFLSFAYLPITLLFFIKNVSGSTSIFLVGLTYHQMFNQNSAMDATCGEGSATLPEHLCSPHVFSVGFMLLNLGLCVVFCGSLFVFLSICV
jgi:hypothetical protein